MVIDAHLHVWQVARGDYGWLEAGSPIYRDFTIGDARAAAVGVDGVILVQAAPTEAETRYLLDVAGGDADFVRGVVGWTDLAADDAIGRIERLARDPKLVGLRPMVQDIADPEWVLRAEVSRALDAMADCDLALDLLIRPVHLAHCVTLARLHPGLRMVIDHAAKPAIAAGDFADWAAAMAAIAAESAICCKLSGLITEAGDGGWEAVGRFGRHVIESFGPDRLIWGSDWPVLNLDSDYRTWLAAARTMTGARDACDIFGANACRFYRLAA